MGDVILTTSLVRQIRNHYPKARIDFVTSKQFTEILKFNPHLSNLIEYDKQSTINEIAVLKKNIKQSLSGGRYDIVIDLQRNLRTKILRSGLGNKYLFVNKLRLHKLSLVYFKRPLLKQIIPIPDIYRLAASPLGIEDDGKGLELWLPDDPPTYKPKKTDSVNKPFKIAIAPGAFHETKRWQKEKFSELIHLLKMQYNADILLVGGVKDKTITDWIKSQINFPYEDCTESNSIIKTAGAIDSADLLVSNDTGVVHIATARRVPVVAVFGSTVKEFGFIPYRIEHEIVEKALYCRPCTHYGLNKCPKVHFNCMNEITVEDVLTSILNILKSTFDFSI